MRRFIALLLMLLLPLQVSWAAVAEYGEHGATLGAPHAELHDHGHVSADAADAAAESAVHAAEDADAHAHTTCCDLHQCHSHGSFAALTTTVSVAAFAAGAAYASEAPGRIPSGHTPSIDRPNWAASPVCN